MFIVKTKDYCQAACHGKQVTKQQKVKSKIEYVRTNRREECLFAKTNIIMNSEPKNIFKCGLQFVNLNDRFRVSFLALHIPATRNFTVYC